MRVRAGVVAILVAVLGWAGGMTPARAAGGHPQHGPAQSPAQVKVRSRDGRVTLPFTLVNNHVIVQATVQGKAVRLIVDTGMPMDGLMLYRNDTVASMKLPIQPGMKARIAGAGEGGGVDADIADGLVADLGDLRLTRARAIVVPPLPGLADYHDGVIGASLFNNFVVAIDYGARRLTLHDPKAWEPPPQAKTVPFTLEHNAPFVDIALLDAAGRRIPATVVVDLGAGHSISLNLGTVEGLALPDRAVRAIVGFGVSGRLPGQVGRIAGLEIGGLTLRDVVATFPDPEVQRPGGAEYRGGNLGNQILQRFDVAFDYRNKRMTLVPNASFDRPFEWDMSGLWLQPAGRELRVGFVVRDSPAGRAGVLVGDVLTTMNGRDVAPADLPGLREKLRQPGEKVDLTVLRDGKPVSLTLTTERMI
jgi:hypothetical protein